MSKWKRAVDAKTQVTCAPVDEKTQVVDLETQVVDLETQVFKEFPLRKFH